MGFEFQTHRNQKLTTRENHRKLTPWKVLLFSSLSKIVFEIWVFYFLIDVCEFLHCIVCLYLGLSCMHGEFVLMVKMLSRFYLLASWLLRNLQKENGVFIMLFSVSYCITVPILVESIEKGDGEECNISFICHQPNIFLYNFNALSFLHFLIRHKIRFLFLFFSEFRQSIGTKVIVTSLITKIWKSQERFKFCRDDAVNIFFGSFVRLYRFFCKCYG